MKLSRSKIDGSIWFVKKLSYLCSRNQISNGSLAEWLGNGLQNRVRRFKSATNLHQ